MERGELYMKSQIEQLTSAANVLAARWRKICSRLEHY